MARKTTMPSSTESGRRKVFVDTGGWYSVAADSDSNHASGAAYFHNLLISKAQLFTSDYVLAETLTCLRMHFGAAPVRLFSRQIAKAIEQQQLILLPIDSEIWRKALEIFERELDYDLTFTDCATIALAQRHNLSEVFSFDSHFQDLGLQIQPVAPR